MIKLKHSLYMVLCLIVGAYMLSGCIEEFEADIPEEDSNLLVVEGTICSSKLNTFVLSRTTSLHATHFQIVMGATVSVRGSDGSEYIAQEDYFREGYGNYSCWIDALNPEVEYYLHIEIEGEVYETEPQKPLRTEKIADVRGVQDTPDSNIDMLVTPDAPFEPDHVNYYSWTCDETWEVHPDYTTILFYDIEKMDRVYRYDQFPERGWKNARVPTMTLGASQSYEGQHIQKLKIYDIDYSDERMYHRYSGLVHQRAISKAEYEYELARKQASSGMGGLFTPQPSALPTNIHCLTSRKHVIGFVGCSLNTSDYRFYLNAEDFSVRYPQRKDARLWVENTTDIDCLMLVEKGMYLCVWDDKRMTEGRLITAWAYGWQLDVRYKGAYIEKPDFWTDEDE